MKPILKRKHSLIHVFTILMNVAEYLGKHHHLKN